VKSTGKPAKVYKEFGRVQAIELALRKKLTGGASVAEPEERTEEAIRVRQVTQVHSNWNEEERGAPGKFSFQLILDNGAEEFVIRPENEDADVLIDLFEQTGTIYFDLDRKVLIFGDVSVKP
jgi:hypothetical protein